MAWAKSSRTKWGIDAARCCSCDWEMRDASAGRARAESALRDERGRGCGECIWVTRIVPRMARPEAGGVVADGLGDAGRLAVGEPGGAVDGVGARRAEHEAHARSGEDDVPHLRAEVELGHLPRPEVEADGGERRSPAPPGAWRRRRSSIRPPIWAATTKPRKKYRRHEARPGRRLAEADLRVLAGEEEHRDEHQHGDAEHDVLDHGTAGSGRCSTSISGDGVRSSTK